jgi:hypothetical protein
MEKGKIHQLWTVKCARCACSVWFKVSTYKEVEETLVKIMWKREREFGWVCSICSPSEGEENAG